MAATGDRTTIHRRRWLRRFLPVATVVALLAPAAVRGQRVVRIDVGANSNSDAYATRVQWFGSRFEGWLAAAGGRDQSLGGWIGTRLGELRLGVGDAPVALSLPTDRLGGAPGLMGRGVVLADSAGPFEWDAFAGWGARARSPVPGLMTAQTSSRMARLDARWAASPTVTWTGFQTFAEGGWTHLESLSWEPSAALRVDATGGRMEGAPFGALTLSTSSRHLELTSVYTWSSGAQRRMAAPDVFFAESTGLNGRLLWRPSQSWYIEASRIRRHPSQLVADPLPPRTVHQVGGGLALGRVSLGGSVQESPDPTGGDASRGARLGVSTRVTPMLRGDLSYFVSRDARGVTTDIGVASLRERVRPALELLQRVTLAGRGKPSVALGGRFERGGSSIGLDYRTDFVPSESGSQFRTALVIDVRLQLSSTSDVTATTYLDGYGNTVYRARAGRWLYPGSQERGGTRRSEAADFDFPDRVVRGRVQLEDGTPVEGAAVAVGDRVLYSDSEGRFLMRTDDAGSMPFEVALGGFLLPGAYRILSAPDEVRAVPEGEAEDVVVVLRKVTPAPASARETR